MNPLLQKYRIFDQVIACDFPLSGLSDASESKPDWRVVRGSEIGETKQIEWFHTWKDANGTDVMAVARAGNFYLLRFLGLGDFLIDFARQSIDVFPQPVCTDATLAHLLVDQVIPRVLCHQGGVVIHASAVHLGGGRVLAFTGPSGRGKSTLASGFAREGYEVLSDDCLLLKYDEEGVQVQSSYPSLRLWPDSTRELWNSVDPELGEVSAVAHYTSKKQVFLRSTESPGKEQRLAMSALYLLDDPEKGGEVRIRPASGTAAIMALVESLFVLDIAEKEQLKADFTRIGEIAAKTKTYHLSYPRRYEDLPRVVAALVENS